MVKATVVASFALATTTILAESSPELAMTVSSESTSEHLCSAQEWRDESTCCGWYRSTAHGRHKDEDQADAFCHAIPESFHPGFEGGMVNTVCNKASAIEQRSVHNPSDCLSLCNKDRDCGYATYFVDSDRCYLARLDRYAKTPCNLHGETVDHPITFRKTAKEVAKNITLGCSGGTKAKCYDTCASHFPDMPEEERECTARCDSTCKSSEPDVDAQGLTSVGTCSDLCADGGHGSVGFISGTAPFCGGTCADCGDGHCYQVESGSVSDYGSGCATGNKVCCCSKASSEVQV